VSRSQDRRWFSGAFGQEPVDSRLDVSRRPNRFGSAHPVFRRSYSGQTGIDASTFTSAGCDGGFDELEWWLAIRSESWFGIELGAKLAQAVRRQASLSRHLELRRGHLSRHLPRDQGGTVSVPTPRSSRRRLIRRAGSNEPAAARRVQERLVLGELRPLGAGTMTTSRPA